MRTMLFVLATMLFLSACSKQPEVYRPNQQQQIDGADRAQRDLDRNMR